MNVNNRFVYSPAYLRFYRFLRASTLVAREQFVRDGERIRAEWKLLSTNNPWFHAMDEEARTDYETSFIVSRLIARAPAMERMP